MGAGWAHLPACRRRHLDATCRPPPGACPCPDLQATLLDLLRAFEAAAPLALVACCG